MDNGLKTIKQLFEGRKVFVIPAYQRSYAWEEKQWKDFLEDIKNQRVNKDYFMGTVLFREDGKEDAFDRVEVVDGQQRITTSIVFMKALIKHIGDKNEAKESIEFLEETYLLYKNKSKLKIQEDDNEFFQTYILKDREDTESHIKTPSQRRLWEAKRYYMRELIVFKQDELIEFKNKIENTKILTYSVSDAAEAALIFETTNDRGKSLTKLEKIKSFLMYRGYIGSKENSSEIINKISKRFKEIYRTLEKTMSKDAEVDEDSILQYHFISYEDWRMKKEYQDYLENIKAKVNRLLRNKEDDKLIEYIENYTTRLRENFDVFDKLLGDKSPQLRDLFLLKRMGVFYPLLIKTYSLDESQSKENFLKISRVLEIFSFRVLGFGARRTTDVDTFLNMLSNKFNGNYVDLVNELKKFILVAMPDSSFKNKLVSKDFYNDLSKNDINYLFWKYENYLRTSSAPRYNPLSEDVLTTRERKYKITIEHIGPQSPGVSTSLVDFDISKEFQESFLNSLGNLTLDPQSTNSSKGNLDVQEKNSRYFQKAPLLTQNELDEFLKESKSEKKDSKAWTKESVMERQEKIVKFALEYWNPEKV